MNDTPTMMAHRNIDADALQSRYALRVTARLAEQSEAVTHDVGERLRFARERALDRARAARAATTSPVLQVGNASAGTLALGGGSWSSSSWWVRFVQVLPLLALVAGLVLIQNQHVRAQIAAAAEIDFDLLVDELPPTAYGDPGFLEFLKARDD
jgi:Protein of unknown function (DUF3619)